MTEVEAVLSDNGEYHRIVEMMSKNVAAYTFYYLTSMHKMNADFVTKLLDKTMDPSLVAEVTDCEWDETTFTLTTPSDHEEDSQDDALANQPWMLDLQQIEADQVKQPSKAAFKLDDRQSLGTMHPQNDEKRKTAVQFGANFEFKDLVDDQHNVDISDDEDEILSDADDATATGYQPNNDNDTSPNSTNLSHKMLAPLERRIRLRWRRRRVG